MKADRAAAGRTRQGGLAALLLLGALAVISVVSAHSLQAGALMDRRNAEAQLRAIGAEYRRALLSYAGVAAEPRGSPARGFGEAAGAGRPPGLLTGPLQLEDLLADPRMPGVRRHLRRIYVDPLTGRAEWGLLRNAQGAIVGIYSLAPGTPIRQAGFDASEIGFDNARSYADWVFGPPAMR